MSQPLHVPDSRKVARARWLWVTCWVTLFVLTHIPVTGHATIRIEHADKVIHFLAYFVLTWLGGRWVARAATASVTGRLWSWALVYSLYGALDEVLQRFTGRTDSVADWLADITGVLAATLLFVRWSERRGLSGQSDQNVDSGNVTRG